jgi:LPXTG-site transpeptidase (sortase) family protein
MTVVVIVLFLMIVFSTPATLPVPDSVKQASSQTSQKNISFTKQAGSGLPIRLKIPKINVDAPVEFVGLTAMGIMGVPAGPSDVGWLDIGPRPGDIGNAVIAGHEGWKDDIRAVFDDLHKLQIGDKIYVEDETGTTTIFVVRELRIYGQNNDALDVFVSSDGKAHLNLITCEGVWNTTEKSYANRLVVFADRE